MLLFAAFGDALVQPGADVLGCIGISAALIAGDQHPAGHHTGDTSQPDPLPYPAHGKSLPKLPG